MAESQDKNCNKCLTKRINITLNENKESRITKRLSQSIIETDEISIKETQEIDTTTASINIRKVKLASYVIRNT